MSPLAYLMVLVPVVVWGVLAALWRALPGAWVFLTENVGMQVIVAAAVARLVDNHWSTALRAAKHVAASTAFPTLVITERECPVLYEFVRVRLPGRAKHVTGGERGALETRDPPQVELGAAFPSLLRLDGRLLSVTVLPPTMGVASPGLAITQLWPRQGARDMDGLLQFLGRQGEVASVAARLASRMLPLYRNVTVGAGFAWTPCGKVRCRPPATVFLPNNAMEELVRDALQFLGAAEAYEESGRPYRRGYLFYGPPGTGKSSAALALATAAAVPVCVLSCSNPTLSDVDLAQLVADSPCPSVVLLEDVDCAGVPSKTRGSALASAEDSARRRLTLSGLLNAIDGTGAQEGRLLVMTTNHVDQLDAALTRRGRVDLAVSFPYLSCEQATAMVLAAFPDAPKPLLAQFAASLADTATAAELVALLGAVTSPEELLVPKPGFALTRPVNSARTTNACHACCGILGCAEWYLRAGEIPCSAASVQYVNRVDACPALLFRTVGVSVGVAEKDVLRLCAQFGVADEAAVSLLVAPELRGAVSMQCFQSVVGGSDCPRAAAAELAARAAGSHTTPDVPMSFTMEELVYHTMPQWSTAQAEAVAARLTRQGYTLRTLFDPEFVKVVSAARDAEAEETWFKDRLKRLEIERLDRCRGTLKDARLHMNAPEFAGLLEELYGLPVPAGLTVARAVCRAPGRVLPVAHSRLCVLAAGSDLDTMVEKVHRAVAAHEAWVAGLSKAKTD